VAQKKISLEELVLNSGLCSDRDRARALIMAGKVRLNGQKADKAGVLYSAEAVITLAEAKTGVSRAGDKLRAAFKEFAISAQGKICADVGACTGGFSQVLLEQGASKVYAIDVGYGDLAWEIRSDPRVVCLERTNARFLATLPEPIDLVTVDVSFISVKSILPVARNWLSKSGEFVVLIKPQFEAARDKIPSGGVIVDPATHHDVLTQLLCWMDGEGFGVAGLIASPVAGAEGNREFLVWLGHSSGAKFDWQHSLRKLSKVLI
jgi:23S rRNA (cytidine1920-2'-O)/16S rRNA (cytidine1409-2'-O)-methyltransferase